ncbi:MAG: chemotaxis protein CheA, partial [Planctomycetes bacterium]|nr:chemotaxis protein CheA [Planctomycetota bacterium]
MPNENDELILSFVEEANEVLADVENDFLAIEEAGANIDKELVNKIFRGIHSLKGSSGFLGLKSIGALAHEMENVLNLIRNEELVPSSQIVDPLLKGADVLRSMVGQIETSNEVDVSENIKLLKASVTAEVSEDTKELLDREVDIAFPGGSLAFVMVTEMDLVSRQRQGCDIYIVEVDLFADVHSKKRTPLEFLKTSYEHGELIQSYMSTAGIGDLTSDLPDSLNLVILFASKLNQKELGKKIEIPVKQVHPIATASQTQWDSTGPSIPESAKGPAPAKPVESSNTDQAQSEPKKSNPPTPSSTPAPQAHSSLRVSVKVLDVLMNLAGELVLGRNQLLQIVDTKDYRGFESVAARIDQVTSELQEAIMQTRMQAIGTVFNKFPRLIRDMSSKLGKECDLLIEGKDVEMDKTIIEAIGDPLTHLVRNAIDHGVESPQVRTNAGKPPRGTIILKAFHEAGKVNLSISDDGAGIDAGKLRKKAIEKGLITEEQAKQMTDRQAIALIFHPGFSTAEKVTDVSGRGVGMDVVKTNIEMLGGHVDVDTTLGSGSTVNIKLPLTLAIIPSLVVRSGKEKFAIPQVNISELVHIKASQVTQKIEKVKDAEVLRLRGKILPLLRLSEVLDKETKYLDVHSRELNDDGRINMADQKAGQGTPEGDADDNRSNEDRRTDTATRSMSIIVVETGKLRYGLIV